MSWFCVHSNINMELVRADGDGEETRSIPPQAVGGAEEERMVPQMSPQPRQQAESSSCRTRQLNFTKSACG
ncbi:hypothetical protein EON64_00785 [archaeon]|nr:MAG: hypothetical protein EON64_00785 [archaeon]